MAAEALEQSVLESKDKDQLLAIAKALGLKANSRTKKAEIIDSILEMTGSSAPVAAATNGDVPAVVDEQPSSEGLNGSAVSNGEAGGPAGLPAGSSAQVSDVDPARRRSATARQCSVKTVSRSPSGSSPSGAPPRSKRSPHHRQMARRRRRRTT